ncbi:MAG: GAF domain-containing protein [Anaerolineae bacterium]|nr:GAF domain-containing protein [Anaerolineae bacterium]
MRDLDLLNLATVVGVRTSAIASMTVGTRRIGVVQIANKRDGSAFSRDDVALLSVFATQAAIVVENTRLYETEQRRAEELSGLQRISQTLAALSDPDKLYAQLNQRIAQLMGVEMCGVLRYDAAQQALVSQPPFHGVADDLVRAYRIPLAEGSPTHDLFTRSDVWYTNDVGGGRTGARHRPRQARGGPQRGADRAGGARGGWAAARRGAGVEQARRRVHRGGCAGARALRGAGRRHHRQRAPLPREPAPH